VCVCVCVCVCVITKADTIRLAFGRDAQDFVFLTL